MDFAEAISSENLDQIRTFPKADLHNHFVLGGNRDYILEKTGYKINPIADPLKTMSEMDAWSGKYIGNRFNSPEGRKLLIEATFAQAREDGVTILEIGEDVWGLGEFFGNDIEELISTFGIITVMCTMFYILNLYRIGMIRNSLFFGTGDLKLIPVKVK